MPENAAPGGVINDPTILGGFTAKGILFDCDGVLVDSDQAAEVAWAEWADEYAPGFSFGRDIVHGRPAADTVAELVAEPLRAAAGQRLRELEVETARLSTPIPGAVEFVRSLPDGSWAVVTSGLPDVARARLAAAGFAQPDIIVTAADITYGKPHPEPYLLGASRLGIDPADAIVFEDAPAGITSATDAGVGLTVGVGERGSKTAANALIDSFVGLSVVTVSEDSFVLSSARRVTIDGQSSSSSLPESETR
ncbi:HAD-IA family hydrolase [Lysinibacter cavernae]|uniref:Sugar-phosphatase n=1 Tax=Lysinibacter cavernae TaxID=1640652 RepID=A0A7X5R0H5_9MICO|nr:sugar-phosphatase [Lysinibacter cavernae]